MQDAEAGAQVFLGMTAALHHLGEQLHRGWADGESAQHELLVGELDDGAVALGPVRCIGGELAACRAASLRGDAHLPMENLDAARSQSHVDGLADHLVGMVTSGQACTDAAPS